MVRSASRASQYRSHAVAAWLVSESSQPIEPIGQTR